MPPRDAPAKIGRARARHAPRSPAGGAWGRGHAAACAAGRTVLERKPCERCVGTREVQKLGAYLPSREARNLCLHTLWRCGFWNSTPPAKRETGEHAGAPRHTSQQRTPQTGARHVQTWGKSPPHATQRPPGGFSQTRQGGLLGPRERCGIWPWHIRIHVEARERDRAEGNGRQYGQGAEGGHHPGGGRREREA